MFPQASVREGNPLTTNATFIEGSSRSKISNVLHRLPWDKSGDVQRVFGEPLDGMVYGEVTDARGRWMFQRSVLANFLSAEIGEIRRSVGPSPSWQKEQ